MMSRRHGIDSDSFMPAYRRLDPGALRNRAAQAVEMLRHCRACPRHCGVDRLENETGFCGVGRHARVACAFPHFGEEDVLRGTRGSGTLFLSGCNLHCVFCQNCDISQRITGPPYPAEMLAELMIEVQSAGSHNINFVSPSHVLPQVLEALVIAVDRGLRLPIIYNSGGYDSLETLALIDGIVDIYMPDFKFWRPETARRLGQAEDYPERTREALREMHRQTGPLSFGSDGLARRGVLLRHLVLPDLIEESAALFQWIADNLSPATYINIMDQYRPENEVGPDRFPEINRRVSPDEMTETYAAARAAGLHRFA
jgi:putative pyruvate formate lyase activating enzyme